MKGTVWLSLTQNYAPRSGRLVRRNTRGALSLPLLLALLAASFMGFGTWGLMRHWRKLTELQLRLDRCVGDTALELKGALNRIESENRQIQAIRAAIAAGSLAGGAGQAMKPALEFEVARQEFELLRWRMRQAQWLMRRGCDEEPDLPRPLPEMSWFRPPPDMIGSQPLEWMGKGERRLKVEIRHSPRAASALVESGAGSWATGEFIGGSNWKATWTAPGTLAGAIPGFAAGRVGANID